MSNGGAIIYSDMHLAKLARGYERIIADAKKKYVDDMEVLILTLRQVKQCFKSADQSSTCVEDHHPSCLKLVEARLKEYDVHSLRGQRGEAQGS